MRGGESEGGSEGGSERGTGIVVSICGLESTSEHTLPTYSAF